MWCSGQLVPRVATKRSARGTHLALLPEAGEGLRDGELAGCSTAVGHGPGYVHPDRGPPPSAASVEPRSSRRRGGLGGGGGGRQTEERGDGDGEGQGFFFFLCELRPAILRRSRVTCSDGERLYLNGQV